MATAKLCFSKGAGATAVAHPNNRKMYYYKFNYIFIIFKYIILKHVFYSYVFQEASLHRLTIGHAGAFRLYLGFLGTWIFWHFAAIVQKMVCRLFKTNFHFSP